jgi:hypothetical protein
MMLRRGLLIVLVAATTAVVAAYAQSKKGPNGGTVITSQGHPIEFVLKEQELVFYISDDDGSPLPTKDMRGRATIQDGGKTTSISLSSAAPNMMVGKLQASVGSKARVVFSANLHGHSLTARYVTE